MAIPTTEELRRRIAAHGNIYGLAKRAGLPRTTVQNIARGVVVAPRGDTLAALLCALDELETMTVPPGESASANH